MRDAPEAAHRAARTIQQKFALLETKPALGRIVSGELGLRELLIAFGSSGYAALYRYKEGETALFILAFRHQRQAGY